MRFVFFGLLVFSVLLACAPAQARKLPRLSALKQAKLQQKILPLANVHVKVPRYSIPSPIQKLAHAPKLVPAPDAPIRASVLPLRETIQPMYGEEPFTASSFVIEEEFEGKKHLWGVTAAHIATILNAYPAVMIDNGNISLPIEFVANGSAGMADLALFPLDDMKGIITPLKLAQQTPKPGEQTYSFGFFNNSFYLVPNRTVQEITPNRIITSLEFDTQARGGACGGPVLNANGEVTGVHIGSSDSKQISFVVPAAEIVRLLHAYRNNGSAQKMIVFNGKQLFPININEHIEKIYTKTNNQFTEEFAAYHREKEIDYNHLETLVQNQNPDQLQIFITHKPFAANGEEDASYVIRVTYDLHHDRVSYDQVPTGPDDYTKPRTRRGQDR